MLRLASARSSEHDPEALGLARDVLARFVASIGPLAVVDLETTGLAGRPRRRDPRVRRGAGRPGRARACATRARAACGRAGRCRARSRGSPGSRDADLAGAPPLASVAPALRALARGPHASSRTTPTSSAHFLARFVAPALGARRLPRHARPARASRTPTRRTCGSRRFTRVLLGTRGAPPRARRRARHGARALRGRRAARARGRGALPRRARARSRRFAPDSPWLALLGKEALAAPLDEPVAVRRDRREREARVPFDAGRDRRGARATRRAAARHFPGYRVREEQIELALRFAREPRRRRGAAARGRHRRREVARLPRRGDPLRDRARRGAASARRS